MFQINYSALNFLSFFKNVFKRQFRILTQLILLPTYKTENQVKNLGMLRNRYVERNNHFAVIKRKVFLFYFQFNLISNLHGYSREK